MFLLNFSFFSAHVPIFFFSSSYSLFTSFLFLVLQRRCANISFRGKKWVRVQTQVPSDFYSSRPSKFQLRHMLYAGTKLKLIKLRIFGLLYDELRLFYCFSFDLDWTLDDSRTKQCSDD